MNPEIGEEAPKLPNPNAHDGVSEFQALTATEKASAQALEHGAPSSDGHAALAAFQGSNNSTVSMKLDDPQASASMPQANDHPVIAEDGDLIEKEWVDMAKRIVERTKDDPYKQSTELTRVKADYMKKRYNKEIKIDEKV